MPLRRIADNRGSVLHMMRNTDDHFMSFGEIYFSTVLPNCVKAWHLHKEMTINYAVPLGKIKFVLYDNRPESPTNGQIDELIIGEDNYVLVSVPPRIWNGFAGLHDEVSLVANCTTIPHDPDEIERMDFSTNKIPYSWS